MVSFLSSMAVSAESAVSIETGLDQQIVSGDLDSRLTEFVEFVKDLHKKDLLDGEVLDRKSVV